MNPRVTLRRLKTSKSNPNTGKTSSNRGKGVGTRGRRGTDKATKKGNDATLIEGGNSNRENDSIQRNFIPGVSGNMPSEDDSNTDKLPQIANESGRKTKTGKLSGLNRGTAGAKNVACQEQRRTRRVLAPREEKKSSDNSGNFLTDDDEVTQREEEDTIAEHANRRHTGGLSGLSRGTAGVKNVTCQEQRRTRGELAPRGEKELSDNSGDEVTQHEEDNTVEEYSIRQKRGKKLSEIVRGKSRQVSDVTTTEEDDEEFYAQRFLTGKQKDSCSSKTGKAVRNNNNKTVRFHELNVVSDNEEAMSDDDFGGPPEWNEGKSFYKDISASERVQRANRSKVQVGRAVEQFNVLPQRRTSTASAVTRCKASKQSSYFV